MKNMLAIVLLILLTGSMTFASSIKATAQPEADVIAVGQRIEIPVHVDLSNLPEALGSFTAVLTWNPKTLKYVSCSAGHTDGFTNPVINAQKAAQGKIIFAAANPNGAMGRVNVLNVVFQVTGAVDANSDLDLEFTAMAAAKTFFDLLPYLSVATGVRDNIRVTDLPTEYALEQNYPNPFNPNTRIQYQVPQQSHVKLTVFNSVGQEVVTLVNDVKMAGHHAVTWAAMDNSKSMPAGIYIYRLQAGDFTSVRKMLLVK